MGRNKEILRVEYKTQKIGISKKDIDSGLFEAIVNRRMVVASTVNSIFKGLMNDVHFSASFVVNKKNGRFRLIDGNHRYEAIKKYLAIHPKNTVEITMHVYDNLTIEQEREMYTLYNQGRKQSTNDFVQQYKDDIPIYKLIQKDNTFPLKISVYGSSISLAFFKLIGPYLACHKLNFPGGYIGKPLDFIEDAKKLNQKDVKILSSFLTDYLAAFGPFKNNRWFKTTPLGAIMKIWYDNYEIVPPSKMVKMFRTKLVKDFLAVDLISNSGAKGCTFAREKYLEFLNSSGKKIFRNMDGELDLKFV